MNNCVDQNDKTLLTVSGVSKTYGTTKALSKVDFDINKGEVIGLVGENGAGKSTLLKIIMGVEQPDEGDMQFMGAPYTPKNPRDANEYGVGMVFQEQSLITNLTVAQNIFFGHEKEFKKCGLIDWKEMAVKARGVLDKLGLDNINPNKKISDIQFSRRQMIEIVKVLNRVSHGRESGALILLDEPTSVLNAEEIETLYEKVREMKEADNGVVFISHRLSEVMNICDRIFVFKDGQNVCEMPTEEASEAILYEKMVGKSSAKEFYRNEMQKPAGKKVLVKAEHVSAFGLFHDVSFELHEGEILGVCGVVGSGKESLTSVIAGDIKHSSGKLVVDGRERTYSSPHKALKDGIINIPTERRVEGQIGISSIEDNMIYSNVEKVSKNGLVSRKLQRQQAEQWIEHLRIKCQGPEQHMEGLSGGNAQKVVFARVLGSDSKIIVLNHPTRGVDVGAKEEIYEIIREASAKGIGIILLGDTLDESIGLAHKLIVMKDGFVTEVVDAPADNKPEQIDILRHMM